jgi:hypothetical protein
MKMTIEIPNALLRWARNLATEEDAPLELIIERELRRLFPAPDTPFRLRRASFAGSGRRIEFADATWRELYETIDRQHGGKPSV